MNNLTESIMAIMGRKLHGCNSATQATRVAQVLDQMKVDAGVFLFATPIKTEDGWTVEASTGSYNGFTPTIQIAFFPTDGDRMRGGIDTPALRKVIGE